MAAIGQDKRAGNGGGNGGASINGDFSPSSESGSKSFSVAIGGMGGDGNTGGDVTVANRGKIDSTE